MVLNLLLKVGHCILTHTNTRTHTGKMSYIILQLEEMSTFPKIVASLIIIFAIILYPMFVIVMMHQERSKNKRSGTEQ